MGTLHLLLNDVIQQMKKTQHRFFQLCKAETWRTKAHRSLRLLEIVVLQMILQSSARATFSEEPADLQQRRKTTELLEAGEDSSGPRTAAET